MSPRHTVFVDGQEGTTGLRIHEYLAARPDIEVLRISADQRKDPAERARLLNAADVAFLCLPDAASREAVALVTNPKTCLIDASTAFRTDPSWAFGLPESWRTAGRSNVTWKSAGCPERTRLAERLSSFKIPSNHLIYINKRTKYF